MSQKIGTFQNLSEKQIQKLTPQQLLLVNITEMPIAEFEQCVKNELSENAALEEGKEKDDDNHFETEYEDGEVQETATQIELNDYSSPDDIPDYLKNKIEYSEREQQPIGDSTTFLDDLTEQMVNYDLTDHQKDLIDYLIGSLDDNGFLDQSLARIEDEMLFKHGIETDSTELEEALAILQQFDPAGIGARNTQESLLIQLNRKLEDERISEEKTKLLRLERKIITDEYENFKNKNFEKIAKNFSVNSRIIEYAVNDMSKTLNPRPGRALCESASDRIQTATPDFIVETDGEGDVSFHLNHGEVPTLHVSKTFKDEVNKYQEKGEKLSRHEKEGLQYYKEKVESAQNFIDAIRQRQHTLTITMRAIIEKQKPFFLSKDENDLNTLILKDIADMTHLDESTVSRVCKTKFALVDGRLYPLTYFFKHNRKNSEGQEVESDKVALSIRQLVDSEDKRKPLTDDQLVERLKKLGINIARRTVNKYRTELAIPVASKRKS